MIEYSSHKIKGIIAEIKETQSMIALHKSGNDPLDSFMSMQFVGRKKKLFRELLAELVLSDLRFQDLKRFIDRLAAYLETSEESKSMPSEIQSNLAEVEGMMAF